MRYTKINLPALVLFLICASASAQDYDDGQGGAIGVGSFGQVQRGDQCVERTAIRPDITLAGCLARCSYLNCSYGGFQQSDRGAQCINYYDAYHPIDDEYESVFDASEAEVRIRCEVPVRPGSTDLAIEGPGLEDIHDCTWGNDNIAHCLEDFCLPPIDEGGEDVCYVDVPICFDHYGREVDCP